MTFWLSLLKKAFKLINSSKPFNNYISILLKFITCYDFCIAQVCFASSVTQSFSKLHNNKNLFIIFSTITYQYWRNLHWIRYDTSQV